MWDTPLLRHSLHFTTLHPNALNSTSLHLSTLHFLSFKLHPTTLHYPLIWLKLHLNFIPLHFTSHHFISLHCTFRWFSPHFSSFHFTPFIIAFLTLFLKILGLQGNVPNASAGSWLWCKCYQTYFEIRRYLVLISTKISQIMNDIIISLSHLVKWNALVISIFNMRYFR
jgi:hypothetical protein